MQFNDPKSILAHLALLDKTVARADPPLVFCVDSPERCLQSDYDLLIYILLVLWPERISSKHKVVVLTCRPAVELPSSISAKCEIVNRICQHPIDRDEFIVAYLSDMLVKTCEIDPEWSSDVVDLAAKVAAGSFYLAALFKPTFVSLKARFLNVLFIPCPRNELTQHGDAGTQSSSSSDAIAVASKGFV